MHFINLYSEPEILESFLIKCLICSFQVSVSLIIIPRNFIASTCLIYNIEIENSYCLNKDNPKFNIFTYDLEDDFKPNSILEYYMIIQHITI